MTGGSSKFKVQSLREAQSAKLNYGDASVGGDGLLGHSDLPDGILRETPPDGGDRHAWNLEERTALFGERLIHFLKKVPRDPANNRLIDQLVGAGTSVGANYCEASQAVSTKDFRHTVSRCVKEAKETKFFLLMVAASEPQLAAEARPLYREAHELLCIFASMRRK